jgi:hypothetical protein
MHGFINGRRRRRQSARRYFSNDGRRLAAIRAVTGAERYLAGQASSYAAAAESCGSCVAYVKAAAAIATAKDWRLMDRVLSGQVPLLVAGGRVKDVAKLIAAFSAASAADRVAFAKAIGPTVLFDDTLAPAVDGEVVV